MLAETGAHRGRGICSVSVGVRGEMVSGRMRVGVAVADDLEVEVVSVPAAGEHGVQLLPGLLPGQQAVHGVGGDALRGVDGGGIAETGRGPAHSQRQPDGQLAAVCRTVRSPLADAGDGPAVAVLDPVGGRSRSRRSLLRVMITSPTLA